jgi:hypothetical protein
MAMPLVAQSSNSQQSKPTIDTSKQAIPLNTDLTVQGNVTAQGVLIPRRIAKAVFGGKIADEYAVVQVTINNKSSDAALIVQGVYIDYSKWALAGGGISEQPCAEEASTEPKSKFAACTKPSQVASEEYRVVRGQALNAQTWTWRNGIVRGLTLAGAVATAYAFTVSGTKYPKAVSGATGTFIPGLGTFWPDQTIDQINRISDLGYQTNKVISKQGSDIIVCFFPIDRFLSSGFRQIFLKEPALFFSPYEILLDKKARERILAPHGLHPTVNPNDLLNALKIDPKKLAEALPCYVEYGKGLMGAKSLAGATEQTRKAKQEEEEYIPDWVKTIRSHTPDDCSSILKPDIVRALDSLAAVSLNTIHVVIDGLMSVATASLPAKIESVEFDNEKTNATLWTDTSKPLTGTIKGSYLTGGAPKIQNSDALGIESLAAATDGSTDQALKFSFKLKNSISDGTQLTFTVEKTPKDATGAQTTSASAPFIYKVQYVHGVPTIDSVVLEGEDTDPKLWTSSGSKKGTIKGSNLTGSKPLIDKADTLGISNLAADTANATDQTLPFTFNLAKSFNKGDKLSFTVQKEQTDAQGAKTTLSSPPYGYTVDTDPVISNVEAKDHIVTVSGKRFFNDQKQLVVSLKPSEGSSISVSKFTQQTPTTLVFDFSSPGCWSVEVKVGEASVTSKAFAVAPDPTVSNATIDAKSSTITVAGTGFVDTSACGGPALAFQVVEKENGPTPLSLTRKSLSTSNATFETPSGVKKGWLVQALLGKQVRSTKLLVEVPAKR